MTSPILERIRRCLATGDTGEVSAPAAVADAARAVLPAIGTALPPQLLRELGMLHWLRHCALPPGSTGTDLEACLNLFAPLAEPFPAVVPPPVLSWLQDNPGPRTTPTALGPFYATVVADIALTAGEPTLTDLAIALCRAAVDSETDRPAHLFDLMILTCQRYEWAADETDLDDAIAAGRAVLGSPVHPLVARARFPLGTALLTRFGSRGQVRDLTDSTALLRDAAASLPPDDPTRAAHLSQLALALQNHCATGGPLAVVEEYVEVTGRALACCGADDPALGGAHLLHGNALRLRFIRTGDAGDIAGSVRHAREAVAAFPEGDEAHVAAQLNLAASLQIRFVHASTFGTAGGPDDADRTEAAALARAADAAVPEGHPLRWEVDATLATMHRIEGTDTAPAVRAARATLAGLTADSPHRATALLTLGEALRLEHQETGNPDTLRKAVAVLREASTAGTGGPLGRTPMVLALSMALYETVKLAGTPDEDVLDEAIETTRSAVREVDDTRARAHRLWQLAELLRTRFHRAGQAADLDAWIEAVRATVPLVPGPAALAQCLFALAEALKVRYRRGWEPADLDESVTASCRGVEAMAPTDPALPDRQADTAIALVQRFETTGDRADQEAAARLVGAALGATGADSPNRHRLLGILAMVLAPAAAADRDVARLTEAVETCRAATPPGAVPELHVTLTLSSALVARYENTGAEADLEAAATGLRTALAQATGVSRSLLVTNLVLVLGLRFNRCRDPADLDEAVDIGKAALTEFPPASPDAQLLAANVATVQTDRFEWVRDPADLDEATDTLRSVLDRARADDINLPTFQLRLGNVLRVRFLVTAEPTDLDEAVAVLRAGLAATRSRGQEVLFNLILGSALALRGQWSTDATALTEADELLRTARAELPPAHMGRGLAGMFLVAMLRLRFIDSGDETVLTEATEIIRDVLGADAQVNQSNALMLLGSLLTLRFERTGDPGVLGESIEVLRGAVAAAGTNSAMAAGALSELANALRARQGLLATPEDLDEAVTLAERALALPGTPATERGTRVTTLANALLSRSLHTGDAGDLDAAVDLSRRARSLPDSQVGKAINLGALGLGLWRQFDRTGAVGDLHAAIDVLFEAAATVHPRHSMRPVMLTNLSNGLRTRANLLGSVADLDAAVDTGRSAVDAAPAGYPGLPLCLMNLGIALYTRYLEKDDPADLNAAVNALTEATDRGTGPNQVEILINLALLLRARRRPGSDDLDRAVALGREAVAITGVAHPLFPQCVLNLSNMLHTRYDRERRDADAVESARLARQALSALPAGDPRVALAWLTLGRLHERGHVDDPGGHDAYRTAAETSAAPPGLRAFAARMWATSAVRRGDWVAATEGFGVAVALLPEVAWHGVERDSRERRLTMWDGLARSAAAAALAAGDPGRAVELLEQGRSVLWSQALQTRDDLSVLRERDPELHDRLRAVAAMLTATTTADVPEGAATADPWSGGSQHRQFDLIRLAEDWDRLLAQARALPGMEYLLRVPPLATLRDGLPDGPTVLVNVDETRCDALVVRRDRDVEHIPLPDLSHAETTRRAKDYLRALRRLANPGGPGDLETTSARQTLHATLEWLWHTVAEPVLTRLGHTGQEEPLPRLWWCPTGALTLLPLHAAGYHDPADVPAGRTVIDRAVSSYTPTLRALTRANTAGTADTGERRLLVVSMPETPPADGVPGFCPLPGARAEAEFLSHTFPLGHTVRVADAATHTAVTADLRTHAYVHFACHGGQNLRDPSTGALYLRDGPLTVLDVAELDLAHAELAYLSACSTAIGGTALPDEAIHLAAALQLSGYRHVIATLWTITDRTAADVTAAMYTSLLGPSGLRLDDTARLLHRTTHALRDSAPRNPTIWASYIHSGP